jgi:hypothetical protein
MESASNTQIVSRPAEETSLSFVERVNHERTNCRDTVAIHAGARISVKPRIELRQEDAFLDMNKLRSEKSAANSA